MKVKSGSQDELGSIKSNLCLLITKLVGSCTLEDKEFFQIEYLAVILDEAWYLEGSEGWKLVQKHVVQVPKILPSPPSF